MKEDGTKTVLMKYSRNFKFFLILLILFISIYFLFKQDKPIGTIIEKQDDIKIIYPKDLEEIQGIIKIEGIADENFKFVEVQVDLNGWEKASGVKNWNYLFDASNLEQGLHTVYARASDNIKYSKVKAVRININEIRDKLLKIISDQR